MAELFLLAWAIAATVAWGYMKTKYDASMRITTEIFYKVSHGKMRVVDTGDSFDFEEL
jgi:hypothetical protein